MLGESGRGRIDEKKTAIAATQMEAASEVTRGRGAADEEEGCVGGLPGVRDGVFLCLSESDCTSDFVRRVFTESLKTTICLPFFSFLCISFLVSPLFPPSFSSSPPGYNSHRVHRGSRDFHLLELPPPPGYWRRASIEQVYSDGCRP